MSSELASTGDENVSDGGATPRPATGRTRTDDGRVMSNELASNEDDDEEVTSYRSIRNTLL